MTNRIEVAVTLTVDVDADEWALDYGRDVDVRRDVRDTAAYAVLYMNPAVKSVTWKHIDAVEILFPGGES